MQKLVSVCDGEGCEAILNVGHAVLVQGSYLGLLGTDPPAKPRELGWMDKGGDGRKEYCFPCLVKRITRENIEHVRELRSACEGELKRLNPRDRGVDEN